jgi:hypothetical protein
VRARDAERRKKNAYVRRLRNGYLFIDRKTLTLVDYIRWSTCFLLMEEWSMIRLSSYSVNLFSFTNRIFEYLLLFVIQPEHVHMMCLTNNIVRQYEEAP